MTHTPGPWTVEEWGDEVVVARLSGAPLATIRKTNSLGGERKQNALLIAAARAEILKKCRTLIPDNEWPNLRRGNDGLPVGDF